MVPGARRRLAGARRGAGARGALGGGAAGAQSDPEPTPCGFRPGERGWCGAVSVR